MEEVGIAALEDLNSMHTQTNNSTALRRHRAKQRPHYSKQKVLIKCHRRFMPAGKDKGKARFNMARLMRTQDASHHRQVIWTSTDSYARCLCVVPQANRHPNLWVSTPTDIVRDEERQAPTESQCSRNSQARESSILSAGEEVGKRFTSSISERLLHVAGQR